MEAGDIEHQAANLQQPSEVVIHAEGIDEDVDGRTVLAAKRGLEVPQVAIFLHGLGVAAGAAREKNKLGSEYRPAAVLRGWNSPSMATMASLTSTKRPSGVLKKSPSWMLSNNSR